MNADRGQPGDEHRAWAALAELYHRYLTGLLLGMVTRLGTEPAAEVVFRTFRNQHLEAFHPGMIDERLLVQALRDARHRIAFFLKVITCRGIDSL